MSVEPEAGRAPLTFLRESGKVLASQPLAIVAIVASVVAIKLTQKQNSKGTPPAAGTNHGEPRSI